jgi:hypothetical protein
LYLRHHNQYIRPPRVSGGILNTVFISLNKQGFILLLSLSLILQAVKCHATSRVRYVAANPAIT